MAHAIPGRSIMIEYLAHPCRTPSRMCVTPMSNHVFGIVVYGGRGADDHLPTFVFGPDKTIAWLKAKMTENNKVHWEKVRAMLVRRPVPTAGD